MSDYWNTSNATEYRTFERIPLEVQELVVLAFQKNSLNIEDFELQNFWFRKYESEYHCASIGNNRYDGYIIYIYGTDPKNFATKCVQVFED